MEAREDRNGRFFTVTPRRVLGDNILKKGIQNGIHTLIQVVGPFGNLPPNQQNFIPATG